MLSWVQIAHAQLRIMLNKWTQNQSNHKLNRFIIFIIIFILIYILGSDETLLNFSTSGVKSAEHAHVTFPCAEISNIHIYNASNITDQVYKKSFWITQWFCTVICEVALSESSLDIPSAISIRDFELSRDWCTDSPRNWRLDIWRARYSPQYSFDLVNRS